MKKILGPAGNLTWDPFLLNVPALCYTILLIFTKIWIGYLESEIFDLTLSQLFNDKITAKEMGLLNFKSALVAIETCILRRIYVAMVQFLIALLQRAFYVLVTYQLLRSILIRSYVAGTWFVRRCASWVRIHDLHILWINWIQTV